MKRFLTIALALVAFLAALIGSYYLGIREAINSATLVECSDCHAQIMFGEYDDIIFPL